MKLCTTCNKFKTTSFFHKRKTGKNGINSQCKECRNKLCRDWRKKHPRSGYLSHAKWCKENANKCRENSSAWRKKYPEKKLAQVNKRKAIKLKAVPLWADLDKIKELYKQARTMTKNTGIKHHVDHIVPLKGQNVCGLHVECNLQILTAKDNLIKGNRFV